MGAFRIPCTTICAGGPNVDDGEGFLADVAGRLANRVQLTTDGHRPYLAAGEDAFGADFDYADQGLRRDTNPEKRHSLPVCLGCKVEEVTERRTRSTSR
jgi:hypothetical protein